MVAPIDLNLLRAFVAVHEAGSFSAAAGRLGVPRSTVSRAVAELEADLGVGLFERTTRKVTTTAEGVGLFARVAPQLAGLEAALSDLPERERAPTGTLRVTAIADLASAVLVEAVTRFTARYPDVDVELHLTNDLVDLAREGFDLALRVVITAPRQGSLVARKVGVMQSALYASPSYVARRGAPRGPDDFVAHDWVGFRGARPLVPDAAQLRPRSRIVCDDMRLALELVRGGGGVGALPTFIARGDLLAGTLVRVMPRWVVDTGSVYLVRPARQHVPRRVTLFRDLVLEIVKQRPLVPDDGSDSP
jgi:DNA-binding transcriptional LysR family regulator